MLDSILDNSIIIVDDLIKNKIVYEYRKKYMLKDVKFISFSEFNNRYFFSYDNKSVYYLMNKYNYKYDVAKVYIDNLYYITDGYYESEKLNFLKSIKEELDKEKLLSYDIYFKDLLNFKNVYVYSKKTISKFYKSIFDKLNVTYLTDEIETNKTYKIYEFKDIKSEVTFICEKIIELIKSGVDINKIKLCNVKDNYINSVIRIFKLYNIPISELVKTSLYSISIGKYFIDNLTNNRYEIIEKLSNNFKENTEEINELINILNKYTWCDNLLDIKSILIEEVKNTYVKVSELKNKVEVINIFDIVMDDEYVFLLNFNHGEIPNINKDLEYITDNIKNEINLELTVEKNLNSYNDTLKFINSVKNITISYKLNDGSLKYLISTLSENMDYTIIKDYKFSFNLSNLSNKLELSNYLDIYSKYGEIDKNLPILLSNYKNINYMSYNSKFKGIDKSKLDEKLVLSYTSMDNYYRCAFRYYIENVLKLTTYEETFMAFIGNIYHYILSIMEKEDFDLDKEYESYIKNANIEFSKKELFFLNKLKKELSFVIEVIKEQSTYSTLDKRYYEEKIIVDKGNNNLFMGFVDKIMYSNTLLGDVVSIVDYKTGNPSVSVESIKTGIGMQLPIYMYLISKSSKFNRPIFGGFYLQKVLPPLVNRDGISSYNDLKKNNLKLQGYSNSDVFILSLVDKTYENSKVIKSLRTSSKGFYAYSKVLSSSDIKHIIESVDEKIDNAISEIRNANFTINPKRVGKVNVGCEYCKYKDICNVRENDIVTLEESEVENNDTY